MACCWATLENTARFDPPPEHMMLTLNMSSTIGPVSESPKDSMPPTGTTKVSENGTPVAVKMAESAPEPKEEGPEAGSDTYQPSAPPPARVTCDPLIRTVSPALSGSAEICWKPRTATKGLLNPLISAQPADCASAALPDPTAASAPKIRAVCILGNSKLPSPVSDSAIFGVCTGPCVGGVGVLINVNRTTYARCCIKSYHHK